MDFFGFISLFGGLALFLYGMSVLGGSLEKASEGRLERILERLTGSDMPYRNRASPPNRLIKPKKSKSWSS